MSRRLAALLLILSAALAHGADPAPAGAGAAAAAAADPQARIEALRADGRRLRKEAEATYAAGERLCYERFLVNQCIAEAKEARLETIRRARELEAEARTLDLAERRRRAAERGLPADAAGPTAPAAPAAPASPAPSAPAAVSPLPSPSPDARVEPNAEAERIRAQREAELRAAEPAARAAREAQDAERAAARAKAEAEAAARAEEAARDRAKYEERLRRYEEEQANKKKDDK